MEREITMFHVLINEETKQQSVANIGFCLGSPPCIVVRIVVFALQRFDADRDGAARHDQGSSSIEQIVSYFSKHACPE